MSKDSRSQESPSQKQQPAGADKPSYKQTLNLLETGFGMRANATQREPQLQAFWKEQGIDQRLGEENTGEPFTLHDGPPYALSLIHI